MKMKRSPCDLMGRETVWNSQSNWRIGSGSIPDCITFQSSLDEDEDDDDSTPAPLLLFPPHPPSPPCEIKITFSDKHDLRQIYLRSTARVYEIYYAPNSLSHNHYLSTVPCGLALRDHHLLRSPSFQLAPSQSFPSQDLYEATAEISDADPCISVTLRLLSLQNKACVYVDEIYLFADPVDPSDSESQESHIQNSSRTSLMAMFLPLIQSSKTTGLANLNALTKDNQHVPLPTDSLTKPQLKGNASITDLKDVTFNEAKADWVGPTQPHAKTKSNTANLDSTCSVAPSKFAEMENNYTAVPFKFAKPECNHSADCSPVAIPESNHGDSLGGNVQRALEHLVSRMDKIEDICLGFQEKMVRPMSSIEARLQRVEQQLDTLTKKLQNSALVSRCTFSAPDASCIIESDANSSDNCPHYVVTKDSEPDEKHLHTEEPYVSPHLSDSVNTTQLLPGFAVIAPEFPDGEDEEGNASGQETKTSKDRGEQSIDDALSSALANFLSSMSLESPKYTKSLTVKTHEFSNEDDGDHGSNSEMVKNDPVHHSDSEEISHIPMLAPSDTSLENREKINSNSNDKHFEKTAHEAEEYDQIFSAEGDQDELTVKTNILAEHALKTGFIDNCVEDKNGLINGENSDVLSSNVSDISNELLYNQIPWGYSITEEGASSGTENTVAAEVPKKTFHESIIENVLGFSLVSSVVDFENPILDVKFIPQTSPATSFLEDLLVENQEGSNSRDPSVKESDDDLSVVKSHGDVSVKEQSNLISIEDGELVNTASDSYFAGEKDLCILITASVNMEEGDNLPLSEDHKRKQDEI